MTTSTPETPAWIPPPWEPPLAGTETEHLLGAITRMRTTFRWKAGHLDPAGLAATLGPSTLTLGGLLLHLAMVEDYMFTTKLRGEELVEPWRSLGHDGTDDWEFTGAAGGFAPEDLDLLSALLPALSVVTEVREAAVSMTSTHEAPAAEATVCHSAVTRVRRLGSRGACGSAVLPSPTSTTDRPESAGMSCWACR